MEISEIKQRLGLREVLHYYDIEPKNNILLCPFHADQTASLQVHLEKNFCNCHACGKTGDVIQFVQDYEKLSKHEAIIKCKSFIINLPQAEKLPIPTTTPINETERTAFLTKMFLSFRKGLMSSPLAKDYCHSRALDYELLEIGFNGGEFHHGTRKEEQLIKTCLKYGLLSMTGTNSRTEGQAYKVFGNKGIVFPLKNKSNEIVSLYFRSIIDNNQSQHYYLKDRQDLYLQYPNPNTKKLMLTESIIDAASLLQITHVQKNYSVLACYGVNGLNAEIQQAIKGLTELEEIIFCFDNDQVGRTATADYATLFSTLYPHVKVTGIPVLVKDVNDDLIQTAHIDNYISLVIENRHPVLQETVPSKLK